MCLVLPDPHFSSACTLVELLLAPSEIEVHIIGCAIISRLFFYIRYRHRSAKRRCQILLERFLVRRLRMEIKAGLLLRL